MGKLTITHISCAILNFVMFFVLLILTIDFTSTLKFEEIECKINSLDYPTSEYYLNISNNKDKFVNCDCVINCIYSGYCFKIFGKIVQNNQIQILENTTNTNSNIMFYDSSIEKFNYYCTFSETKCKYGERIENRIEVFDNLQNTYSKYFEYLNNNESITCYQNKENPNQIFLRNEFDLTTYIILIVVFILCILIWITCWLYNKCIKNQTSQAVV